MPGGLTKNFKEDITMIAKEKKQAIIKEFGRTEGDTENLRIRFCEVSALLGKMERLAQWNKINKFFRDSC